MEIEIIKDDLNKEIYRFYQNKMVFTLSYYFKQTRQSKRHGWRSILFYDRTFKRNSNISEHEIPLTDEVIRMVTGKAIQEIIITK
jgi:hypothetical protein